MRRFMKHGFSSANLKNADRFLSVPYTLRRESNQLCGMLCGVIAAMYLFSFALQWILFAIGYQKTPSTEFSAILNYLLIGSVSMLSILLPAVIFMAALRIKPAQILVCNSVKPCVGFAVFWICAAVCLLANIPASIIAAFLEGIGLQGSSGTLPGVTSVSGGIVSFLAMAVVPPFVEEFLFRGLLMSKFRKFGDGFAVIATAFLFGLMHHNISQMVFAFICGMALGMALVKTNNIWIPVAIHMFVNGFSVLLSLIQTQTENTMIYASVFYLVLLSTVFCALLAILYLLLSKYPLPRLQPGVLAVASALGNLFANPCTIIFTVACAGLTLANLGVF